jgi:hypothetical protein
LGANVDTLGFAYFPSDGGDVFINDAIYWEFDPGAENYLYLTAAHEIGHALGLDHSSDPAALMYPYRTDQTTGIASDDIQAIQYLYGSNDGSMPPMDDGDPGVVQPDDTSGGEDGTWYADGFLDDSIPYELWEIDVAAGETLAITITRVDGDLLPYLGLLSYDEETVLAEADALSETQASMTLTFPEAGTFLIMATRDGIEEGTTSGSYSLDIQSVSTDIGNTTADDYYGGVVQLVNYSGSDICELYIVISNPTDWGEDWLEGVPVVNGEAIEGELEANYYDVLAVTCDGYEIAGYELPVASGSTIEVYEDIVTVYP